MSYLKLNYPARATRVSSIRPVTSNYIDDLRSISINKPPQSVKFKDNSIVLKVKDLQNYIINSVAGEDNEGFITDMTRKFSSVLRELTNISS